MYTPTTHFSYELPARVHTYMHTSVSTQCPHCAASSSQSAGRQLPLTHTCRCPWEEARVQTHWPRPHPTGGPTHEPQKCSLGELWWPWLGGSGAAPSSVCSIQPGHGGHGGHLICGITHSAVCPSSSARNSSAGNLSFSFVPVISKSTEIRQVEYTQLDSM